MIEMTLSRQTTPEPLTSTKSKKPLDILKLLRDAGIEGKVLAKIEVNKFGEYVGHEIMSSRITLKS